MNIRNSAVKIFSAVAAAVMILTTSGCRNVSDIDSGESSESSSESTEPAESAESVINTVIPWTFKYYFDGFTYEGYYNGYALSGEPHGKGIFTGSTPEGNYIHLSGNFETGTTIRGALLDISYVPGAFEPFDLERVKVVGDIVDGLFEGSVEMTEFFGAGDNINNFSVSELNYVHGIAQGMGKVRNFFTYAYSEENGVTHMESTGIYVDGKLTKPYVYVAYNGNTVIHSGTITE